MKERGVNFSHYGTSSFDFRSGIREYDFLKMDDIFDTSLGNGEVSFHGSGRLNHTFQAAFHHHHLIPLYLSISAARGAHSSLFFTPMDVVVRVTTA